MRSVLLAHGLEGSPQGTKARALRDAGFELTAPDGRGLVLAERLRVLEELLGELGSDAVLVGSSYGGLASAYLASRRRVAGLVLLAPALHWSEAPVEQPGSLIVPPMTPITVIHGLRDSVVPAQVSRDFCGRHPHAELIEVDDDHRLAGSLPTIIEAVRQQASR